MYEVIRTSDPAVFQALELEVQRQRHHLELIASENYASRAVMQSMGSHFTNKYAEGYPGKRYYGGGSQVYYWYYITQAKFQDSKTTVSFT